jgi:hypothetical protein
MSNTASAATGSPSQAALHWHGRGQGAGAANPANPTSPASPIPVWEFRGGVTGAESARALSGQSALSLTRVRARVANTDIAAPVAPCTTQTCQHHLHDHHRY